MMSLSMILWRFYVLYNSFSVMRVLLNEEQLIFEKNLEAATP